MIEINNLTKKKIDERYLKRAGEAALGEIKKKGSEVSLALVGEKRMRTLNKTYRGKDKPTDVLSFGRIDERGKFVLPSGDLAKRDKAPEKIIRLGEVVVCLPVARKQAKQNKHSLTKELAVLLIHGILHLAGHHHERGGKEAARTERLQKKISNLLATPH